MALLCFTALRLLNWWFHREKCGKRHITKQWATWATTGIEAPSRVLEQPQRKQPNEEEMRMFSWWFYWEILIIIEKVNNMGSSQRQKLQTCVFCGVCVYIYIYIYVYIFCWMFQPISPWIDAKIWRNHQWRYPNENGQQSIIKKKIGLSPLTIVVGHWAKTCWQILKRQAWDGITKTGFTCVKSHVSGVPVSCMWELRMHGWIDK